MKLLLKTETLPFPLMNYRWSREQKWYRVKHNIFTHFPKEDRNCGICLRTKITRAPCRRRNGEAVPRAEIFGDLITADHKVLSQNCESRSNHQYAFVVQDLATQWLQSCDTKSSQETERSLRTFLDPSEKPKVIYTDNSLEFGKVCEELSWNHGLIVPRRMVLLRERYAESRKGHLRWRRSGSENIHFNPGSPTPTRRPR